MTFFCKFADHFLSGCILLVLVLHVVYIFTPVLLDTFSTDSLNTLPGHNIIYRVVKIVCRPK